MRGGGPIAPRGSLPAEAKPYRTIGPFDAQSLPKGLRGEHNLKEGTWGVIELSAGALRFVWDDDAGGVEHVTAPATLVVPPKVLHHVEGDGPFLLSITFNRA